MVDLASGQSRRVLDGHPSTQAEWGLVMMTDGQPLRPPGWRGVGFAAGIALSADRHAIYKQALKG